MKKFKSTQPLTNHEKLEKLKYRDEDYKQFQDKISQK